MEKLIEKIIADDPTNGAYHLIALAYEMRKAQKEYFKTRSFQVLNESKRLEKNFDKEIERFVRSFETPNATLFDDQEPF